MTPAPLCADCQHHRDRQRGGPLCTRKGIIHLTNHATSTRRECLTFCNTVENERSRWAPWACGKQGRHFIAKGEAV